MYAGCFLQTRFSAILRVPFDLKRRSKFCLKTHALDIEAFRKNTSVISLGHDFKKFGRVLV